MRRLLAVTITIVSCLIWVGLVSAHERGKFRPPEYYLNHVNPDFMITVDQTYDWHLFKDLGGPTYSGNPAWYRYHEFLNPKFQEYGVVDIVHNSWTYKRWYTSEWPDDTNWTLVSDGQPVRVAHYGANSGSTGPAGITAQLVYYDPANPPVDTAGKILVIKNTPYPDPPYTEAFKSRSTLSDYEYRTDSETFPPIFAKQDPSKTTQQIVWYELGLISGNINILKKTGAAGGIFVFDQGYDQLSGLYSFSSPALYNVPTLFLDRNAGSKVIEDAKNGKMATLKLLATEETVETYQFIGYLPGKNYGTPEDEMIYLTTHDDGPSLVQEGGALATLGIIHYFSHIPQAHRPRTLFIYMNNRHYMPGGDSAYNQYNYSNRYPEVMDKVVASMGTEHMGGIEFREVGDIYEPTGLAEPGRLYSRNNPMLIEMAIEAAIDNEFPRCQVKVPEKPGANGGTQGPWYGMGSIAQSRDIPGFGVGPSPSGFWSTRGRIDRFDADLFVAQLATSCQLVGELMLVDLVAANSVWGKLPTAIEVLPDEAFTDPTLADEHTNALLNKLDAVFHLVRTAGKITEIGPLRHVKAMLYRVAINKLQHDVEKKIIHWIAQEHQAALLEMVEKAISMLEAKL